MKQHKIVNENKTVNLIQSEFIAKSKILLIFIFDTI